MAPVDPHAGMEIRSFHVVFRLERRLHRIDRWRLPFPHGIPVAAIGHAAAVLCLIVALGQLPGLGAILGALPAPLTYVLAPAAAAMALTRLRIDGRPAHRYLLARTTNALTPQRTAVARPAPLSPHPIPDGPLLTHSPTATAYPACEITGPATVRLLRPARAHARARTLHMRAIPGPTLTRPKVIRLAPGQRLRIRSQT
ncbi:hypothetical protein GKE82_11355 [Conexibacter sp. W3-3-2]|uniref:TcpE family conjugal transfer membrane protein n=1 Tax=Conexibacter sp. W3-3-2 TaxID=2675227 RepID=UPI0012BA2719|nr:TcpE family conjugal transfer membrane protein [Conexibacter sp. W3-3-2]MTD44871.1 hypothetical protein [Conexibacter sp. W3-3-2]